jgi:uncharacterized membrane protein
MTATAESLDGFERRLRSLEHELADLRRAAAQEVAAPVVRDTVSQAPAPPPAPLPPRAFPQPPAAPPPRPSAPPRPSPPPEPPRELDLSFLFGARALAWTGGAVTLLGIVFFFVLAVDRGWIGPAARVSLGAAASTIVFGAGLWLRRRFGESYASLSAAGAGIAGAYATLLAGTALYDLLPAPAALVAAGAIAAAGGALALAWDAETVAGLGLVGAILVPAAVALDGGLTAVGTAFAACVLVATLVVGVARRWNALIVAAAAASAPQILVLALEGNEYALPLAIAFSLAYGAAGVAYALRDGLARVSASLVVGGAAVAGWCAGLLYDGRTEGVALLVIAVGYAAAGVVLYLRDRDVSSLLMAVGLAVGAVAAADLVSGATLTVAWAAEAAVLAWLARRIDEPRFQLASLGWLLLALVHGIGIDAPFVRLFIEGQDPGAGVVSAVALAAATALVGLVAFDWTPRDEGALGRIVEQVRVAQPHLRTGGLAAAAILAVYGASLALVAAVPTWDWGHAAVAGLWSAIALAAVAVGSRRSATLEAAGLGGFAATMTLAVIYDAGVLAPEPRAAAFAAVACAALAAAVAHTLGVRRPWAGVGAAAILASAGFATAATVTLFAGRVEGAALLVVAAAYGAVGTGVLRLHRDLASVLGVVALVLAAPASIEILDGTWLVLAWAAAGVGLAAAARFESRLELGAAAYLALAAAHALAVDAPPADLVVAARHPGAGAPALLVVAAAGLAFARFRALLRGQVLWAVGALGLYGATLAILEGFEAAGGGVDAAFQRGHTTVSAVWGAVGLALLYAGLRRRVRALQLGGFALFGVSLAKVFVYDLAFLSSVSRALSFLAVGGVLLLAGFFYQRLAVDSTA